MVLQFERSISWVGSSPYSTGCYNREKNDGIVDLGTILADGYCNQSGV
jgi:hypothetical protein